MGTTHQCQRITPEALASLDVLVFATTGELAFSDEQKKAISDAVARVQKLLSEEATKAVGDASKKVGDLQKSLPK